MMRNGRERENKPRRYSHWGQFESAGPEKHLVGAGSLNLSPPFHTFPLRTQLNGSLYSHTAYRGHCSPQHQRQISKRKTLTHIVLQPLQAINVNMWSNAAHLPQCQYMKQCGASLSASPSVTVLLTLSQRESFIRFRILGIIFQNIIICYFSHGVQLDAWVREGMGRERIIGPSITAK